MKEEFVIVDCFSGRYYAGDFDSGSAITPMFRVIGNPQYMSFETYPHAEFILKSLNVEKGMILKIEKYYVKE